jgi:hypothetical protein
MINEVLIRTDGIDVEVGHVQNPDGSFLCRLSCLFSMRVSHVPMVIELRQAGKARSKAERPYFMLGKR